MAAAKSMSGFETERDAKEYLIARITTEAKRQRIELSEIERKMLYFTETGWTLPGILDANADFERNYDNDEYESKIGGIVRSIENKNARMSGDEQALWDDAVVKLSEGDHYLLVLIGLGRSEPSARTSKWLPVAGAVDKRPKGDFLRLIIVALLVLMATGMLFWLRDRF